MIDILISIFLGIIEGITEWLPISSTGHMILVNEFIGKAGSFFETDVFLYVIQLGAILAIVTLYFKRLNPFAPSKTPEEKKATWSMWFKVIVACLPAAIIGLLLNDFMDNFENAWVVSAMLILYGIGFIIVEGRRSTAKVTDVNSLTYKTALLIGAFQVLSIVPGTSRSGATIIGGLLLGLSRTTAAEFTFFLAIPVMAGGSLLKLLKFGFSFTALEAGILLVGTAVSCVVSIVVIRFLLDYVRRRNFNVFAYYRIMLGVLVLAYFLLFRS